MSWHCCFLLHFALFCPNGMDFSKFSDENFDVKEWVNSALRIRDDRTPIDVSFMVCNVYTVLLFMHDLCNLTA